MKARRELISYNVNHGGVISFPNTARGGQFLGLGHATHNSLSSIDPLET